MMDGNKKHAISYLAGLCSYADMSQTTRIVLQKVVPVREEIS